MAEIAILKSTLEGLRGQVLSVAFHPMALLLATGSDDNTAKLWRLSPDGSAATCIATLAGKNGHSDIVTSVAFHPTEPLLATGSWDSTAKLWRFSPDGSAANNMQATCVATLEGHSEDILSVAFDSTGTILATGSKDTFTKLWRFSPDGSAENNMQATCEATLGGPGGWVFSVAFHPTAPLLATGLADNNTKLWHFSLSGSAANNMSAVCVATLRGHSRYVTSVVFHPTKPLLATGSGDNTAKLWRFSLSGSAANCMATLEGHSSTVYSVAFHPTESILATGSEDKTVKLWRFSPSGSVVICVETLDKHIASVRSVAFHTKVPLLATGSKDHTAKIWELNIQNIQNIYMSDDGTKVIRIKENLLKPKRNLANNSCINFMPLYSFIMGFDLNDPFRFEFKGQNVVDLTGLTRIVFDKLLPIYTKFFFEQSKKSTFILLKENYLKPLFIKHTKKIIELAKAAKSQIVLGIDPELINLLLSKDLKKYFIENKRQKFQKFYSNINSAIQNNSFVEINENNTFLRINKNENGKNRVINRYRKTQEQDQEIRNMLKSEIRLRRFLVEYGFISWKQVENMHEFIQNFWNSSNEYKIIFYKNGTEVKLDLFVSELSLDVESFKRRIKIEKEDTREILDLSNIPQELFEIYPAFNPLLVYILNESKEGNENRKTFVKYVTGTEYSPAEILIKLTDETMRKNLFEGQPFYGHTCSNIIDLFKASESFNGKITTNIINTQLKATTSHNSNIRGAER